MTRVRRETAADHMEHTRRVMQEIVAAGERLEISLRRIDGGNVSTRVRQRAEPEA